MCSERIVETLIIYLYGPPLSEAASTVPGLDRRSWRLISKIFLDLKRPSRRTLTINDVEGGTFGLHLCKSRGGSRVRKATHLACSDSDNGMVISFDLSSLAKLKVLSSVPIDSLIEAITLEDLMVISM